MRWPMSSALMRSPQKRWYALLVGSLDVKKYALNGLRVLVTAGAILWVLSKLSWYDELHLVDGTVLRGRAERVESGYVIELRDGGHRKLAGSALRPDQPYQPGLVSAFRRLRSVWLLPAFCCYPLALFIGAVRWRALLRAHELDPGLATALRLTWVGYFWNLVLPGLTGGDVVKAYCVARAGRKRSAAVLTVFLDRGIGLCGLALLSAIVIAFNLRQPELRAVSGGILAFLLAAFLGGVLFFSRRLRRWSGLEWLINHLPFQRLVQALDSALFEYRYHKRTLAFTLALSVVVHVVNVSVFYFAGRALALPVEWQHYFVFIPVVLMVA
ncbi:MAG TPA: flippase-like domain-containing protein, partial [Planctomycetaceae bacterium]|nr:flippase-like domain-containing protein [Planctomycetaceae bacterium]